MDQDIDIRLYLQTLWRQKIILVAGALICGVGGAIYHKTYALPPLLVAEASVVVAEHPALDTQSRKVIERSSLNIAALRSAAIGLRVLKSDMQGSDEGSDIWAYMSGETRLPAQKALTALFNSVRFEEKIKGVITVEAMFRDSIAAASVANAFVDELVRHHAEQASRRSAEQLAFLTERVAAIQSEVLASEDSVSTLRTQLHGTNEPTRRTRLTREITNRLLVSETRVSLLNSLLRQSEEIRWRARLEAPTIESIGYAEPIFAYSLDWSGRTRTLVGLALGFAIAAVVALVRGGIATSREDGPTVD